MIEIDREIDINAIPFSIIVSKDIIELKEMSQVNQGISNTMLQLGYQYLVYDNLGLCCIAYRLAIYILCIPFLMCMNICL